MKIHLANRKPANPRRILGSFMLPLILGVLFSATSLANDQAKEIANRFEDGTHILSFEVLGFLEVEQLGELALEDWGYDKTLHFAACRMDSQLYGGDGLSEQFLLELKPDDPYSSRINELGIGEFAIANLSGPAYPHSFSPETKAAYEELAGTRKYFSMRGGLATFKGAESEQIFQAGIARVQAQLALNLPSLRGARTTAAGTDWRLELGPAGPLKIWKQSQPTEDQEPDVQVELNTQDQQLLSSRMLSMPKLSNSALGYATGKGQPKVQLTIYTQRGRTRLSIAPNSIDLAPTIEARWFAGILQAGGTLGHGLEGLAALHDMTPLLPAPSPSVSIEERAKQMADQLRPSSSKEQAVLTFKVIEKLSFNQRKLGASLNGQPLPLEIPMLNCRVLRSTSKSLAKGADFLMFDLPVDGFELAAPKVKDTPTHMALFNLPAPKVKAPHMQDAALSTAHNLKRLADGRPVLLLQANAHRIDQSNKPSIFRPRSSSPNLEQVRNESDLLPLDLVWSFLP